MCVLIGKAKNRRATCTMAASPALLWICSVKSCRLRVIRRKNMWSRLNSPVFSVVREGNQAILKVKLHRGPTLVKAIPRLQVTSKDVLVQNARQAPPAQRCDVAVSKFENYLRLNIRGAEKLVNHGIYEMRIADLRAVRRSVTSGRHSLCSGCVQTCLWPVWWLKWFSMHERLIFQAISKNISPQFKR